MPNLQFGWQNAFVPWINMAKGAKIFFPGKKKG
jgi:hypothetical protein